MNVNPENSIEAEGEFTLSGTGFELLRDDLLPDILGKETDEILYWAGRRLARKYPCKTMDKITLFFKEAGWGILTKKKDSKKELTAELTSSIVEGRIQSRKNPSFSIESGFLAEQLEQMIDCTAEAQYTIKKKDNKVMFIVRWEPGAQL